MVRMFSRLMQIKMVILLVIFSCSINAQELNDAYQNFYGICWRGTPHDNLLYAHNMGYKYIFYQDGMEKDPLSAGMYFYLEAPEYRIYKRLINRNKKYTAAEINFYNQYCTIARPGNAFPASLATGWFFNDTSFSAELDFSKSNVRDWAVSEILKSIQKIEVANAAFKFAGLAWDVPQLSGDFWSNSQKKQGRQVALSYWTGKTSDKTGYETGKKKYYTQLFKSVRSIYPNARMIMEPYNLYTDWLQYMEAADTACMPDILAQESAGTAFLSEERIQKHPLSGYFNLAYTSPDLASNNEYLMAAGDLAVHGIWFNWFGRFGGSGAAPNYKSVTDVPVFFRLIRAFTSWENLNGTALPERTFKNGAYKSPTAYFSSDLLWAVQPVSKKIYGVFVTTRKGIPVLPGAPKLRVYVLNDLMGTGREITSAFSSDGSNIYLKDRSLLGKAFVMDSDKG
ncbi:MAG: hypothetical protein QM640_16800 [Niabella sp.]